MVNEGWSAPFVLVVTCAPGASKRSMASPRINLSRFKEVSGSCLTQMGRYSPVVVVPMKAGGISNWATSARVGAAGTASKGGEAKGRPARIKTHGARHRRTFQIPNFKPQISNRHLPWDELSARREPAISATNSALGPRIRHGNWVRRKSGSMSQRGRAAGRARRVAVSDRGAKNKRCGSRGVAERGRMGKRTKPTTTMRASAASGTGRTTGGLSRAGSTGNRGKAMSSLAETKLLLYSIAAFRVPRSTWMYRDSVMAGSQKKAERRRARKKEEAIRKQDSFLLPASFLLLKTSHTPNKSTNGIA